MHEFSLASEIWQSVREAAQRHGGGRVRSVKLEIGALTLLADEQITFWIEALAERDGSPGVTVAITHLPGRVRCDACTAEADLPPPPESLEHLLPPSIQCPKCGSAEVVIVGGREVRVVSAEIGPGGTNREADHC